MELPILMTCGMKKQTEKEENPEEGRSRCRGPGAKRQNVVYQGQRDLPSLLVYGTTHSRIEHGPPNVQQHIEREEVCRRRYPYPQVHPTAAVRPGRPRQRPCVPVQ